MKLFFKNHKKILIALFTPVFLFILAVFIVAAYETWVRPYKERKMVQKFQENFEQPYREDVYGGKTPEETWKLFLDALKKGNIDLASKYFVVDKQREYGDILKRSKENNELEQWIKEMENLRKDEEQHISEEKAYYFYNAFSEKYQQILTNSVVFYFNPYTEVWKILIL